MSVFPLNVLVWLQRKWVVSCANANSILYRWVDADSIIINPAIPISIFLPPADLPDIHFVATKDQNGLNSGIFFLRVHPWSISMLTEVMAYPFYKPEVDLGRSADQEAMARVLAKTEGGPNNRGYKSSLLYMPRVWFNTYEWHHAYEGKKGNLLVHFPGLEEDRWSHMQRWLNVIEATPLEWEVPLDETDYPVQTSEFWARFRNAKQLLRTAEQNVEQGDQGRRSLIKSAISKLEQALQEDADNADLVRDRIDELSKAVEST